MDDRTRIIRTVPEEEVVTHHTVAERVAPAMAEVDRVQATAYDPYASRRNSAEKVVQGIWLLFGFIEGLIAIRFVLRALGANPDAGFAQFIYGVTAPLIAPFVGLFGTPAYGTAALELHSIVAMIVYALVGWLLTKLAWLMMGETRSAVTTSATSVDTRVR